MERYLTPVGDPELVELLEERYGHAYRVIVTAGAHQALVACVRAISSFKGYPYMDCQPVFYPGLRHVGLAAGCDLRHQPEDYPAKPSPGVSVAAWPNNPDGMSGGLPAFGWDVWDAVYADEVYGWDGTSPQHRVLVGSVSKTHGLPGLRVGWVACRKEEDELYPYLARHAEALTEGVSGVTQHYAKQALLADVSGMGRWTWRTFLRTRLLDNANLFKESVGWVTDRTMGVPHDGTGMFAWFHVKEVFRSEFEAALKAAGVTLMPGGACGAPEPGWYRMSMSRPTSVTERALALLDRELRVR
jgi:aspartate/methionine/tyrosine aminotransferase